MKNKSSLKAITLMELMLVVTIIAVLASLAIPNVLRARMSAKETVSANLLRIVCAAEIQWRATNPEYATLEEMAGVNPPYIDISLASGKKQGYTIVAVPNQHLDFYVTGVADNPAQGNTYYIDEDGILCRSDSVNTAAPTEHAGVGCPAGFSEVE